MDIGAILFWLGAAWLTYVYAGYPLALAALCLFARPKRAAGGEYRPNVAVLLAARNEERDIEWKVRECLAWDYPADRLEVWVASDASDDRTDEIVRGIGDTRARLVRMERRGGKVRALNRLAQLTGAELLLFTDANAHIGPAALGALVRHFADPAVGCVTGHTGSVRGGEFAVGGGAQVYWGYEAMVSRLEDRLGGVLVCDGAIHCARRECYEPLDPELANDLELPLRIRRRGYRTAWEPLAVAWERDTQSPGEEYARRRRICGQGALAAWKLHHLLRGFAGWQFVSRKILRWLTAIPMVLVLAGSALLAREPFFAALLAGQVVFYLAALGAWALTAAGKRVPRWLAVPFYIVLGAAGAFAGVLETLGGRRFDVWEIPLLSRGKS
ncbi:MAG: glycosyltransferase [Acidobacteriota bacterium]|nr:glycosyltransferase [Acidobacteriota bacterium]